MIPLPAKSTRLKYIPLQTTRSPILPSTPPLVLFIISMVAKQTFSHSCGLVLSADILYEVIDEREKVHGKYEEKIGCYTYYRRDNFISVKC